MFVDAEFSVIRVSEIEGPKYMQQLSMHWIRIGEYPSKMSKLCMDFGRNSYLLYTIANFMIAGARLLRY